MRSKNVSVNGNLLWNNEYYYTYRKNLNYCLPGVSVSGNPHDFHPWSYTAYDIVDAAGSMTRDQYSYGSSSTGTFSGCFGAIPHDPDLYSWNLLMNEALFKLNDKTRGSLNLAVDLLESRQTARMMRKVFKLNQLIRSIGPKRWAERWLEYQYGWRPLVSSIYGIADESIRYVLNSLASFRSSASRPLDSFSSSWDLSGIESGMDGFPTRVSVSGIQSARYHIELKVPSFDMNRWTSLDPAVLLWEILPYSFVVDWIIDIGNTLKALETAANYQKQFVRGYYSQLVAYDVTERITSGKTAALGPFTTRTYKDVKVSATKRFRQFSRVILTSYPSPKLPVFNLHMGWQRWLSAGALLAVALRRR